LEKLKTLSYGIGLSTQQIALAILSGLALTAGFPPVGWIAAPWAAFVLLFWAICDLDAAKSLKAGLIAGLSHYLSLLFWLVPTMNRYGYLPVWLSVIILILLAFYLSLYTALFTFLIAWLRMGPAASLMIIPALWVSLEYLRGVLFTGFPWGLIGYSQYDFLKLVQISDIFGVYGIGFLIMLANCVLFFTLACLSGRKWFNKSVGWPLVTASAAFTIFLTAGAALYGHHRLASIDKMTEHAKKMTISVIQGNIDQDVKWDIEFRNATIDTYFRLSRQELGLNPDLIIWPETAAPFYFGYHADLTEKVVGGIRDMGPYFLIGAPTFEIIEENDQYYNSAYMISPDGRVLQRYDKVHLVPFGEYVPFKKFLPFLGKIVEQVGDFNTGEIGSTLKWGQIDTGVLICYEAIFPGLAAKLVQNNSGLLVSITNDAWFGDTGAPYQHFIMAAFRAIETRRSLVRAANTGISGFIDPSGRILGQTGLFKEAAMTRKLPIIRSCQTPYTRHGDVLVWVCFIASMLYVMIKFLQIKFFPKGKKYGRAT
jgi:apolipoprotein N-acyltransferase